MRTSHVLATGAVLVAIGGCAAVVVGFAAAQPAAHDASGTQAPTSVPSTHAADPVALLPVATPTPSPTHTTHPSRTTPRPATSSRHAQATHAAAPRPTTHVASKPATHPAPKPSSKPAPRRGQALPLGYSTGSATRVITVVAPSTGSTTALLQAWYKAPGGGWLRYGSTVTAHVGSQGLTTHPSESKSATPIGSFTLTQAFGALADPGTALPYFQTTAADWWISQSGPLYNTHQRCSSGCAFTRGSPNEHLRYETPFYNYAVVIDYNRFPSPVANAGSAFFLHVTNGTATAGCVSISQSKLVSLMRWMGPSTHPRILIGVS